MCHSGLWPDSLVRYPPSTLAALIVSDIGAHVQRLLDVSLALSDDKWRSIAESLGLSRRQLQIVRCVFDGLDEPSIGHQLRVFSHTVHSHLNRLYKKIRVKSRCELIVLVFLNYLSRASPSRRRASEVAPRRSGVG